MSNKEESTGVSNSRHQRIFELLAIQFNNEMIVVLYPEKLVNIDGMSNLNANDPLRIRIKQSGMGGESILNNHF